jgi:hypothetical protein
MAGVPLVSAPGGGGPDTRKPFSYCPGGINFSELKSPRMARRIAKHQSQMEPVGQQQQQQQEAVGGVVAPPQPARAAQHLSAGTLPLNKVRPGRMKITDFFIFERNNLSYISSDQGGIGKPKTLHFARPVTSSAF